MGHGTRVIEPGVETPAERIEAIRDLGLCAVAARSELEAMIAGRIGFEEGIEVLSRRDRAEEALAREVEAAARDGIFGLIEASLAATGAWGGGGSAGRDPALRHRAGEAYVDLGAWMGFAAADAVLAQYVPGGQLPASVEMIPDGRLAAFIAACEAVGARAEMERAPEAPARQHGDEPPADAIGRVLIAAWGAAAEISQRPVAETNPGLVGVVLAQALGRVLAREPTYNGRLAMYEACATVMWLAVDDPEGAS